LKSFRIEILGYTMPNRVFWTPDGESYTKFQWYIHAANAAMV
jgi:hypothetical protein